MSRTEVETLSIDGPAGALEAILEDPGLDSERVAVVCHPHPLHGGTMQNKVTHTLARTFNKLGVPAFRFNFRGVGHSAGGYDEGEGGQPAQALALTHTDLEVDLLPSEEAVRAIEARAAAKAAPTCRAQPR